MESRLVIGMHNYSKRIPLRTFTNADVDNTGPETASK